MIIIYILNNRFAHNHSGPLSKELRQIFSHAVLRMCLMSFYLYVYVCIDVFVFDVYNIILSNTEISIYYILCHINNSHGLTFFSH